METSLPDMLLAGARLMLVGMGIVYLFLALLVWIIDITARLLNRYSREPDNLTGPVRIGAETDPGEAELIAAMAAAIHRYRHR